MKTLENAWSCLLKGDNNRHNFERFGVGDFYTHLHEPGEQVNFSDVCEWLDNNTDDPGYQIMPDAKVAASVSASQPEDGSDDNDTDYSASPPMSYLSTAKDAFDTIL